MILDLFEIVAHLLRGTGRYSSDCNVGNAVIVQIGDKFETIPADTVVLAVGAMPVNDLASQTHGSVGQVITIGDAGSPGKITEAVHQGFEEALKV